ncbi:hypothetical protein CEUSTIGMA_g5851.t1 [Chlamydomonas eustigma]|uniref:Uncharacterized protein n=1 Tax=Chlamydomonas eustigma TaxID=1157962 RepID=A0A250X651_9CHLO|nr:hypothetical protein CEUSTIGMA_g5851.t1 [Chlamydomonas eustigma]|eukprot:GAX78409.1 hypothetical protein CEUSTIGMA_g5851.t1 [Chlamydomonas eustigma]
MDIKCFSSMQLGRKSIATAHPVKVVGGRKYAIQVSVKAASLQVASSASNYSKDLTATILQAALSTGLASRLRAHKNISVDVRSTASGLVEGIFGGMCIKGELWETPLSLTAETIEVYVGELLLDYGALITKSTVALKNLPTGHCKIRLSATDLGNFMCHPLLHPISSKAVQGKSFAWDSSSVMIGRDASGAGFVDYEGTWESDDRIYKVRMIQSQMVAQWLHQPRLLGAPPTQHSVSPHALSHQLPLLLVLHTL